MNNGRRSRVSAAVLLGVACLFVTPNFTYAQNQAGVTEVREVTTLVEPVDQTTQVTERVETTPAIEPVNTRASLAVPIENPASSTQNATAIPVQTAPNPVTPVQAPANPTAETSPNPNQSGGAWFNIGGMEEPSLEQPAGNPKQIREAYQRILNEHYNQAIEIATSLSQSPDQFLRANAIEALQPVPERVLLLVQRGLTDQASVVRFASLMTIGELKFKSLGPRAVQLINDRSESVRAAAMFAGYETGQPVRINRLASMLASDSSGVRRNVCLILEKIGDPSAVPMILDMATRRTRKATPLEATLARIVAAKTVVALGDDSEIEVVRASAYSGYPEVRVIAIMALGDLDDRVMQPALSQMLTRQMPQQAPEINLAAAYGLARMGSNEGLATMLRYANMQVLEFDGRKYPAAPLRAQAAAGLKWVNDPRAAQALAKMLKDPVPQVHIAAADAIIASRARLQQDANWP